jgi:hypothetical protein
VGVRPLTGLSPGPASRDKTGGQGEEENEDKERVVRRWRRLRNNVVRRPADPVDPGANENGKAGVV